MAYLDHAATTPMLAEAVSAVLGQFGVAGNASSLHASGRAVRRAVEESREALAEAIGARASEVIVTSGGTEADNLAVKGIFWGRRSADPRKRRLIVSAVEHHAVLEAAGWLADHEGAELDLLPVDASGRVSPDTLDAALAAAPDDVALVSVMWANNEVGTIQPIAELTEIAHRYGVPLHTDAVAAFGQVPLDFAASGADAMTITAHKVGGPAGIGALLLGRSVPCAALLHGGGQERELRSGTLVAPALSGFAAAARIAAAHQAQLAVTLAALRDELIARTLAVVPDAVETAGPDRDRRLPGNAHLRFPGCEGDSLLLLLDARGVECSTGSACSAGVARPSHVLTAMGLTPREARSCLRITLGHTSSAADVDAFVDAIGAVVERSRRAGAVRSW